MPVINRIAEFHDEMTEWRRVIHRNPEVAYEEFATAEYVAERLRSFGIEPKQEIGVTGLVGSLTGGDGSGGRIALRADMDALPIEEIAADREYRSCNHGKMHACGHDGHTAMLLGAAKYLAETRNFNGIVDLIFQPAEEGKAGAKAMIDDGLFRDFPATEVYGMHNMPGVPAGQFAVRSGPMMAARDNFEIRVTGKGAHAAQPHLSVDPVVVGANIVMALQTITSRNLNPLDSLVVSVTQFHAGDTFNVIPQEIEIKGTCRVFSPEVQKTLPDRIGQIVRGIADTYGARVDLNYMHGYPATVNTAKETEFAASIAAEIAGDDGIDLDPTPMMGAEDFSYMLQEKPGCYIWVGNGDSHTLHHPEYDYNDDVLVAGASYWSRLVERRLPKAG